MKYFVISCLSMSVSTGWLTTTQRCRTTRGVTRCQPGEGRPVYLMVHTSESGHKKGKRERNSEPERFLSEHEPENDAAVSEDSVFSRRCSLSIWFRGDQSPDRLTQKRCLFRNTVTKYETDTEIEMNRSREIFLEDESESMYLRC